MGMMGCRMMRIMRRRIKWAGGESEIWVGEEGVEQFVACDQAGRINHHFLLRHGASERQQAA